MNGHVDGYYLAYVGLVLLVALARLIELRVAAHNLAAAKADGGVEHGAGHYPVMVALHVLLLVGCLVEPLVRERPLAPTLSGMMLVLLVGAHALRWWCIRSLGKRWTTRIVVVDGAPLVTRGPYRFLHHPNYVAVVIEGFALPLVHSNWITATVFTVANLALLLIFRIPAEERALAGAAPPRRSRRRGG